MKDDWSLKGREWNMADEIIEYLFDDIYSTFKEYLEYTNNLDKTGDVFVSYMETSQKIRDFLKNNKMFYSKKDIEILRQKLICDIEKYFEKLSEEYKEDFDYIALDIIDIINKRFGINKNGG